MSKKLILHIGTEKTGTTTLQRFFFDNRKKLAGNGILFPLRPGTSEFPNHRKLVTLCMDKGHWDDSHAHLNLKSDKEVDFWKSRVKEDLLEELNCSTLDTHIISSEHFSSRLISSREIEALYSLLKPIYEKIEVVVYLRRQDKYAISLFTTGLKSGSTKKDILPIKDENNRYNYYDLCERWAKVFGKKNMRVRIFEREHFKNKDLIDDFMSLLGINTNNWLRSGNSNPSLTPIAQEFLRRFNKINPKFINGKYNKNHTLMVSFLEKHYAGKPRLPKKEYVENWYKQWSESNKKIGVEYFDKKDIFSDDFSYYPDEWIKYDHAIDDLLKIPIHAWLVFNL